MIINILILAIVGLAYLFRNENNLFHRWSRLIFGLGIGLILWLISYAFIGLFVEVRWVSFALSVIVTSYIYFTYVFPHVTFIVPADKAWIMVNPFTGQSLNLGINAMGFRTIAGQTEFQFGLHWKYPWEGFSKEENMRREIAVRSDPNRTYTFKDGHTIKIDWQITVVPYPGRIVNFNRTKEEDIIRRVKTRAEAFFQGYIGSIDGLGFGKEDRRQLERKFEYIYGGPRRIDDEEEMLGIWTGTPEIYDMGNPETVEEAKNFEIEMESVIDAANKMVKRSKGAMKFEKAMDIAWKMRAFKDGKLELLELGGALDSSKPKKGKS